MVSTRGLTSAERRNITPFLHLWAVLLPIDMGCCWSPSLPGHAGGHAQLLSHHLQAFPTELLPSQSLLSITVRVNSSHLQLLALVLTELHKHTFSIHLSPVTETATDLQDLPKVTDSGFADSSQPSPCPRVPVQPSYAGGRAWVMFSALSPDLIQLLRTPTNWDHHTQPGLWITNSGAGRAHGRGTEIIV